MRLDRRHIASWTPSFNTCNEESDIATDAQKEQENACGGLLDDNIIDTFLSKELLCGPDTIFRDPEAKLRRFAHWRESTRCLCLLGSGEDGVVLLTVIKDVEYALKVVSIAVSYGQCPHLTDMRRSTSNKFTLTPSALRTLNPL